MIVFMHVEMAIMAIWTGLAVVACVVIRFGWRRGRKAGD